MRRNERLTRGRFEPFHANPSGRFRTSHVYIFISSCVALLAVLSPSADKVIGKISTEQSETVGAGKLSDGRERSDHVINGCGDSTLWSEETFTATDIGYASAYGLSQQENNDDAMMYDQQQDAAVGVRKSKVQNKNKKHVKKKRDDNFPNVLEWFQSLYNKNQKVKQKEALMQLDEEHDEKKNDFLIMLRKVFDPSVMQWENVTATSNSTSTSALLSSSLCSFQHGNRNFAKTSTEIIDRVLSSNIRLFAIANLLLAVTFLLHSAVTDFFLNESIASGGGHSLNTINNMSSNHRVLLGMEGGVGASSSVRMYQSGRERLGGYLLFKLLLVSAVVEPGMLDLLILLSWYTVLSFLRSLSYLAGLTNAHASASGQSPQRGVVKLLLIVLLLDCTVALFCAALFHGAGLSMVLLLTCDCILLAVDVMIHLTRYSQQLLEERHQGRLVEIESRQIQLHSEMRNSWESNANAHSEEDTSQTEEHIETEQGGQWEGSIEEAPISAEELHDESRHLDEDMEIIESIHSRHLAFLDHVAFVLDLFLVVITIAHFLHIWSFHGISFNIVDGVLALHLHTAISTAGKKILERRNHNKIARDLDTMFENATELEMRKAFSNGDMCCICLGTMSMGNVKKVPCGHLYHTNCLREVVERARSIEAAKCPLCRASLVNGMQFLPRRTQNDGIAGMSPGVFIVGFGNNAPQALVGRNVQENEDVTLQNRLQEDANQNGNAPGMQENVEPVPAAAIQNGTEHPIFRFSTEGILPAWLPIPAFSFEIVRRPPLGVEMGEDNNPRIQPQLYQQEMTQRGGELDGGDNNPRIQSQGQQMQQQANTNASEFEQQQNQTQPAPTEQSLFQRLLLLTGAVPMSAEQEIVALTQLVDMFPQYDRVDLLRELHDRGSPEGVVEAVLAGAFSGVPRQGAM